MKIAIVSASSRADSQSLRIAELLNKTFYSGDATLIDLHAASLPEWNGTNFGDPRVKQIRTQLKEADGFIFVVPEWNGMAPAAVKNLFLWCSFKQLAHKPALLVAVSAGEGGAFVISEMRASSYKNSRLLYLPEHVILRGVEALWQDCESFESDTESGDDAVSRSEAYLRQRLSYSVDMLDAYTQAMGPVREKMSPLLDTHTNGMS